MSILKQILSVIGLFFIALAATRVFNKISSTSTDISISSGLVITGQTSDVNNTPGAITGIVSSGGIVVTGDDIEVEPIEEVYSIIQNGVEGVDYSVLKFPPQLKVASTKEGLNAYLNNNVKSLIVPSDIASGYLYIRLHQPLKLIRQEQAKQSVPQPINIKTNILVNGIQVRGRLDTNDSLGVQNDYRYQEFLYSLSDISVGKIKGSNWLSMKGKKLSIGGVVSDTQGNYIEKIVFVRKR